MMFFRIIALLTLCVGAFPVDAGEPAKEKAFSEVAASRVVEKPSVQGDEEGWLFLVRELRHLSMGRFWEKPWDEVAANATDPVPSMIEFNALLEERGIQLILAPVPAKGRLYPEKLDGSFSPGDSGSLTPFIELLRSRGLTVIDLDRHFRIERANGDLTKWYCAQDAHYSPQAIEALAGLVAEEFEIESPKDSSMSLSAEILSLTGDQVVGSEWEGKLPGEELNLRAVLNNGDRGIEPDSKSPFLLLGDSHTLVFHQGKEAGMHCRGGGLLDHLSYQFGEAFDLVGVRGSGLVQARKQLYYRAAAEPGFWDRKKLVVWVFSEREFTQSTDRIVSIPLDR